MSVQTAAQSVQPQELFLNGFRSSGQESLIQEKIRNAKGECKQLYDQINRIKGKIQDTQLLNLSHNVDALKAINLKPIQSLKGHNNKIADVHWSKDSMSIVSSSQDGFIIIWDPVTGLKKNAIPLQSQWVLASAVSPNGELVASAGLDNHCTIYRVSKNEGVKQNVISIFKGHTCYISSTRFPDDKRIITASGDMTCALWDIPKSKRVSEFLDHLGDVLCLDLPPHDTERWGNTFVTGGSDGYAYLWDVRQQNSAQSFFVSDSDVSSIKFFNNGDAFMTGSDDGTCRLFDLRSDCRISSYSLSDGLHQRQQIQKNEAYIPSQKMTYESGASMKSPSTLAFKNFGIEDQGVISIDFSKSGRLMFACYADFGCAVWDVVRGEIVDKLEGHRNRINAVKTSPNGLAVVSSSWDMTMKVWAPMCM